MTEGMVARGHDEEKYGPMPLYYRIIIEKYSTGKLPSRTPLHRPVLAAKEELPRRLLSNDFILDGHPMPTRSYRCSLRLLSCLNTETINIWIHLLAFVGFLLIGIMFLILANVPGDSTQQPISSLPQTDKTAIGLFLASAIVYFGISAAFHTFRNHSTPVHLIWRELHSLALCFLGLGVSASFVYYAWYCDLREQNWRFRYWFVSGACMFLPAILAFQTTMAAVFAPGMVIMPKYILYLAYGMVAATVLVPLVHRSVTIDWAEGFQQFGLQFFIVEAVVVLLGLFLSAAKLPERLMPGAFDIWGHSHQLCHLCFAVAAVLHLLGLLVGARYRQVNNC